MAFCGHLRSKMDGNRATEHPRSCRRSNRAQKHTPEPILRSTRLVVRPGGSSLRILSCMEFSLYSYSTPLHSTPTFQQMDPEGGCALAQKGPEASSFHVPGVSKRFLHEGCSSDPPLENPRRVVVSTNVGQWIGVSRLHA